MSASRRLIYGLSLLAAVACTACLCAQERNPQGKTVEITGDRLGGFVLPIEPIQSNIILTAHQVWSWQIDDTLRLQLDGDVQVDLGGYAFSSAVAFVWINRIPSAEGLVNQIAVYFPSVEEPTRRAGLGVAGDNVLVLGTARGSVTLSTSVNTKSPPPITSDAAGNGNGEGPRLPAQRSFPPPIEMIHENSVERGLLAGVRLWRATSTWTKPLRTRIA